MKRRRYVIGILLCVTALLQAQDSVKSFDEFFVAGMDKIDGVFPVYVAEKEIYLEIPEKYIGREIEVSGQIDRGFDLLNRPVDGLGVVRIISPDKATICFQKPFYTERILDEKSTYQQSFSLSNMQPAGKSYPVVAYSKEQGAIIRITEYLMTGDDWFSYNDSFIRSLVPELSEIMKIHPFKEGVSFTVGRSSFMSPKVGVESTLSRASIHPRLPRIVLISPLCARRRNGCANPHVGNVLVLKRECTSASPLVK